MTGLCWVRKSTANIARQLRKVGLTVSSRTVARLLRKLKFSLRVNQRKLGHRHPDRDRQFRHIHRLRRQFTRQGDAIISVDAKKRELVGHFKNPGAKWERQPTAVNDHDFRSQAKGVAVLYGVYDVTANRGAMSVGISHETSAFAGASIRRWWEQQGRQRYPHSRHLLILADTGGSNSASRGAWKDQLQQFSDRCRLTITVAHYPTGASKYNPIERRLFSHISNNWRGEPLHSYDKILKSMRRTTTSTGLSVTARLDRKYYPVGIKPSAQRLRQLNLSRYRFAPRWNYTIAPSCVK
jgi:Rhodopirellula transposase DDE domain